jgi:hypothetical protein
MKRSELRELIKEAIKGYSPQIGTTKGGTSDEFMQILTKIAKGTGRGDVERGNKILDKANPDNIARITRGEEPVYEGEKKLYTKQEVEDYIKNTPPTKYYKIGISKGQSQTVGDVASAIEVLNQSPISQFELNQQGEVIQFSAPYDEKQGAAVRGMGSLD